MKKEAVLAVLILITVIVAFALYASGPFSSPTGFAVHSQNSVCGNLLDIFRAGYSDPNEKSIELISKCSHSELTTYARIKVGADLGSCTGVSASDINNDGEVNHKDLGILLENWNGEGISVDLDENGIVNQGDLGTLLENWGEVRLC